VWDKVQICNKDFFSAAIIVQSPLERCSVVHYIMNFIKYCPLHYNVSTSLCFGIIYQLSRSITKDIIEKQNRQQSQSDMRVKIMIYYDKPFK